MKNSNVCRCCLTKGCSKKLDDEPENYGVMLSNTFNLTLNNNSKRFICDDCVTRLREAASFKQLILEVNSTLNELCTANTNLYVKTDDYDDGFSCEAWLADCKAKDEFDVKLEPVTEVDKTSNQNEVTDITDNNDKHYTKEIASKKTDILKRSTRHLKKKSSLENETQKDQRENSIKLIVNSNICLFKSLRTKFACYVCNEKFFEMKELRVHSTIHTKDDYKRRFKRLRGKSYENADITNLKCNICWEGCASLDVLRKHLNTNHNIISGDENLLIPYKLEEGFQCEICKESFNTFTRLSIHMNIHATSNVCETCGMAFYNRISLRNHIRAIHKEHICSQCSLKFPTTTKLVRHKRKSHSAALAKHYCPRCNMVFRYPYLLKNHMVDKHNGKQTYVNCSTCKKVFKDSNYLKTHFRSVHLNERNFSCSLCELRFFTRTDRMRHERIHQGGSLFSCNLCETTFKSKDSVRRHMKKQHGSISK